VNAQKLGTMDARHYPDWVAVNHASACGAVIATRGQQLTLADATCDNRHGLGLRLPSLGEHTPDRDSTPRSQRSRDIDPHHKECPMAIRCEHVEFIRTTPEQAFAVIDDLPLTAKWLPPCVSLAKIGSGPNTPGDKLRYVYKQGGKSGEMAGEIVARVPGERLLCKYLDSAFEVSVDLRVAPAPDGALTTHIIEITPRKFLAKLMLPLIRLGLRKQTRQAATNLKALLESTPS
jgi:hypothetical protein